MSETPEDSGAAPTASYTCGGLSLARRRLLRGGLGAAPVLMAAAPRSVMAGTCNAASAMATSFAPSGLVANVPQCSGRLPSYWSSCSLTEWPGTCLLIDKNNLAKTKTIDFVDVFKSGYQPKVSLLEALKFSDASTAKDKLAKHVVAALLNVRKQLTPTVVMTETTVRNLWDACNGIGYYEPTAGIKWDAGTCVAWLKSTMS